MQIIIGRSNDGYSYIEYFFHNTYRQLEQLQNYTTNTYLIIEEQLESQSNDLIKKDQDLQEIIKKRCNELIASGEDKEIAFEIAADENGGYNYYTDNIINQEFLVDFTKDSFNKSNIILIYSFLETKILKLCEILKNNNEISFDVYDLNERNYFDNGMIYLEKLFCLNKKDIVTYNHIVKYHKLRNNIVHNEKIKEKDSKVLYDSFKTFINVSEGQIYINDDRISYDFIKKTKCFLREIELQLEEKLNFISLKNRLNDIFCDFDNKSGFNIEKTENNIIIYFNSTKNTFAYYIKIECLKTKNSQKTTIDINHENKDFENEINWRLDEIKKTIVYYLDIDNRLKKYFLKLTVNKSDKK